ncbi:hypothetical protein DXG01_016221 [Tephrocybe rancida]|nr:hypothetical protein DXG01_016221 [Tephrocybe rancida]
MSPAKKMDTKETVDSLIELAAFVEGYDEWEREAAEQRHLSREDQELKEIEDHTKAYEEEMAQAAAEQELWSPTSSLDYCDNEEREGTYQHSPFSIRTNRGKSIIDDYKNVLMLEEESKMMLIEAQGGFAEDQGYIANELVLYDQTKEDEEDND